MQKVEKRYFYIFTFIAFLLHIICLNFYPVNFEFAFFESSNFISNGFDKEIAKRFFEIQANSFSFSFVISFFSLILPFLKPVYIGKFISALSIVLIAFACLNLHERNHKDHLNKNFNLNLFYLFLVLNPLIWVFSYRSTPDVVSMSLAFFGFSLFYRFRENYKLIYLGAIILGIATSFKIITGIYFISSILLFSITEIKKYFYKFIIIGIIYSTIPILCFSITYYNFGFFLFSPYYYEVLSEVTNLKIFINNFVLYTSFLFIFIIPITFGTYINLLINSNYKYLLVNFAILLLLFVTGYKFILSSVEMSFGFLSNYLNEKILNGILLCSSYLLMILLFNYFKKSIKNKNFIDIKNVLVVLIYILIISNSLASQRYLITILPLVYLIFQFNINIKKNLNLIMLTFLLIPINFLLISNQFVTGIAVKEIINYLKKNNLIENTCPGSIGSHAQHEFSTEVRNPIICSEKKYHVTIGSRENKANEVYYVNKKFLFIDKKYKIVEIN